MLELNKIYNMDCLDGLKLLDNDSIDLIVTSPPYNIGKSNAKSTKWRIFSFKGYDVYDDKNPNYDDFIAAVLEECYRVLSPGGSMMFNHKVRTVNKIAVHPLQFVFGSKFNLMQEIVWDLHDTHMHIPGRFYPITEMIYWLTKDSDLTYFNQSCKKFTTIWRMPRAVKHKEGCLHPAPFTIELPKRCIEALSKPGALVLDPFMGSGTTAVAAKMMGRQYVGFELSPEYCKVADDRLSKVTSTNYVYDGISDDVVDVEPQLDDVLNQA